MVFHNPHKKFLAFLTHTNSVEFFHHLKTSQLTNVNNTFALNHFQTIHLHTDVGASATDAASLSFVSSAFSTSLTICAAVWEIVITLSVLRTYEVTPH